MVRSKQVFHKLRMGKFAATCFLVQPLLCLAAVDTASTAYRNGRMAGYLFAGVLLFLIAKRYFGFLAPLRWLIVPVVLIAIWRVAAPGNQASVNDIRAVAAGVRAEEVVMYSTTECVYCAQAKAWLQGNGFAFTECNMSVDTRCEQEFVRLGGTGTPFLMVRGHPMNDGFDSDQFLALLSQ